MTTAFNGQLGLKSSALSPTSSKLTSQYIVLDHMKNHYRKIASAKSAIDMSVPRSIQQSQKVRDRTNRRHVISRSGSRPHSRADDQPIVQQNGYYNDEDWGEPDDDEESQVYTIMRGVLKPERSASNQATVASESLRQDASFEKTLPWPRDHPHRPASARSDHSTRSPCTRQRDSDLLATRAHVFTEPSKPFTPRTLKTNQQSRLGDYRYYNPPQKQTGKATTHTATDDKALGLNSTKVTDSSMMFDSLATRRDVTQAHIAGENLGVPLLDISVDTDNLRWLKDQATQAQKRIRNVDQMKSRDPDLVEEGAGREEVCHSILKNSSRSRNIDRSIGGERSWAGQKLSAEEEELRYVEFVKDVTNDILARGIYTNSVLLRVFENHIQRRLHDLDEKKMRTKLRTLRIELGIPSERVKAPDALDRGVTAAQGGDYSNLNRESLVENMTLSNSNTSDVGLRIYHGEQRNVNNNNGTQFSDNNVEGCDVEYRETGAPSDIKTVTKDLDDASLFKILPSNSIQSDDKNMLNGDDLNYGNSTYDIDKLGNDVVYGNLSASNMCETLNVTSTWHSMDATLERVSRDEQLNTQTGDLFITQTLAECSSEFETLVVENVDEGTKCSGLSALRRKKPRLKPRMRKQGALAETGDVTVKEDDIDVDGAQYQVNTVNWLNEEANGRFAKSEDNSSKIADSVSGDASQVGDSLQKGICDVADADVVANEIVRNSDKKNYSSCDDREIEENEYDDDNDFEDIADEIKDKAEDYQTSDEDF